MSRRQVAILLKELTTVRLICRCGGVSEGTVAAMDNKPGHKFNCPLCGKGLNPPMVGDGDPLIILFTALVEMSKAENVTVEFVIPEDPA